MITADVGYRRGNEVGLKSITDQAVANLDVVEHVVVWRRQGGGGDTAQDPPGSRFR